MSKPTILILSIVYLISILIVGIFGMQIMSFNNVNYIESISLSEKDVSFSDINCSLDFMVDDNETNAYTIVYLYKKGLTIQINPTIKGKDPTIDPTNKNLTVSSDTTNDSITYSNGVFTINSPDTVIFTFYSQDHSNKK
jgi:hypothetical protein